MFGRQSFIVQQMKAKRLASKPMPQNSPRIFVHNASNPHRSKSYRAAAWEALLESRTIAEYIATGFKPKYLRVWAAERRISFDDEMHKADAILPERAIAEEILAEYARACAKFPTWPANLAEAATVFAEEAGETVKAAAEAWWTGGDRQEVEKEAIQAAAMAIRLIVGLRCGHYRFDHVPENLPVDLSRYRETP